MNTKAVYFPNLNGLRALLASLVIVHHVEQTKFIFNKVNYLDIPFFHTAEKLRVLMFFVLSGFLVTYLLLQEKTKADGINIRNFYIRRVLRIWPLYYLLIGLCLFVLPRFDFFRVPGLTDLAQRNFDFKALLFLFMMPHFVATPVPFIYHTWSLGVDEQFYLFWPYLLKRFTKPLWIIGFVIIFYYSVKLGLSFIQQTTPSKGVDLLVNIWGKFLINSLAIGAAAGVVMVKRPQSLLTFIFSRYTQVVAYSLLVYLAVNGVVFTVFTYEFYSLLFAVIILNLAGNPASIVRLEFKLLNELGKISYGLYMYHLVAIFICFKLVQLLPQQSDWLLYGSSFALTIVLAKLSYIGIESRFIEAKKYFISTKSRQAPAMPAPSILPSDAILNQGYAKGA